MPKKIDLVGQKFNRLTVISYSHFDGKSIYWNCLCDCGGTALVKPDNLKSNNTKSCGCKRKEEMSKIGKKIKHGMEGTKIYNTWEGMKQRCTNPKHIAYHRYGGRGITIWKPWEQFENFYADMGDRPEGKSIDRIDNDGNYEPSNCKWSTPLEQANNKG